MRIVLTADAVGGVWRYACELAGALPAHGVHPVVALLGPPPTEAQRAAMPVRVIDTGQPLDWLSGGEPSVRAAADRIAAIAHDERADCVHLNSPTLAAATRWTLPSVAVAHGCGATWWAATRDGPLAPDLVWHRDLMHAGLVAANRTVAPTAAHAMEIAATYKVRAPDVVHNGRGAPSLAHAPMEDCAFTAGRLWDDCKRTPFLDDVASRLCVPFYAAGPTRGPNGETVWPNALVSLGMLDDETMAQRLRSRPVFVSAAVFEPFGLAVLEAAAAGCALVLADTPGFRELWDRVAVFVRPDDERGFVDAIETLIADRGRRLDFGVRACARAVRYTPDRMAAGMAAIYRALAGGERAAA